MAGTLAFTLGLETSKFLSSIGMASSQIIGLAGLGQLMRSAFGNVWGAMERGGALTDLSARTRESVANLYSLQEAFKVVGLSQDSVPAMLLRTQQALSGVSETGEKTEALFKQMGLDMAQLRNMGGAQQIESIANALGRMGRSDAAGIAGRIFGRGAAGDLLQISGDAAGFAEAMAASARASQVFAQNAAAFDRVGDTLVLIKSSFAGMWAGIAAGAAPAIQSVLDLANAFDAVKFGERIGTALLAIVNAFKDGKLADLIALSIEAGVKAGFAVMPGVFAEVGTALINAFKVPIAFIQARLEHGLKSAIGEAFRVVDTIQAFQRGGPLAGVLTYMKGTGAQSFESIFAARMKDFNINGTTLPDMWKVAHEALKQGSEKAKAAMQPLLDAIANLAGIAPAAGAAAGPNGMGGIAAASKMGKQEAASAWEKLGLIIGGGGGNDYAKSTAENTKQIASYALAMHNTLRIIAGAGGPSSLVRI